MSYPRTYQTEPLWAPWARDNFLPELLEGIDIEAIQGAPSPAKRGLEHMTLTVTCDSMESEEHFTSTCWEFEQVTFYDA